jgi:predicted transcriptional regulator
MMLNGRVILNLDEQLISHIDAEKERTGATRNSIVSRILEQHFAERQETRRLYDAWFMAEVVKGVRSAREEPLVNHEDVVKQIRSIITRTREKNAVEVV